MKKGSKVRLKKGRMCKLGANKKGRNERKEEGGRK